MKAKEYLNQLPLLDIMINQKIKEAEDLRTRLTLVGGVDYTKPSVQTSYSPNAAFAEILQKIMDLENKINSEIDNFVDKKHTIINQIQGLKNYNHVEILYKRYIEYKSFNVIAKEMNYTYQYIRELHGRALQDFERTYKNLHTDVL